MLRKVIYCLAAATPMLARSDCQAPLVPARPCPYPKKEANGAPKIQASFLFWQSKMGGLEFGAKSFIPSNPASTTQTYNQKLYVPDFAWHPGVKVLYGYNLPYDAWDTQARYTYYHGDTTSLKKHLDSQTGALGVGVVPQWHFPFVGYVTTPSTNPLRFRSASANWDLYFSSMDVEFGREFLTLRSLPLRLHLGAKVGWIRQYYHANYSSSTPFTGILSTPGTINLQYQKSKMAFSSRAWGLGPRAGFDSKWKIGCGFSLIADAAFSLLSYFTNIGTRYDDYLQNLDAGTPVEYHIKLSEKIKELAPVAEAKLGFDWGRCFCRCGRPIYFAMTVAYEVQYWWSQNHARRNYPYNAPANMWDSRGDLQFQGLNLALRWDY